MRQFFSPKEIADAAGITERAVNQMASKSHWRHQDAKARKREGRGGGWEYHVSLLPQVAQARLMVIHSAPANANRNKTADVRSKLWATYEGLSKDRKAACEGRLFSWLFNRSYVRDSKFTKCTSFICQLPNGI